MVDRIKKHYRDNWQEFSEWRLDRGPIEELPAAFRVLKLQPTAKRNAWTYATCGMSQDEHEHGLELFMIAPTENDFLIELLTAIAHYHFTGEPLGLGHTVNFGCPWYDGSICDHGLISLPYLDGPGLEWLNMDAKRVRFLWLIPITGDEVQYKKKHGAKALEDLFEDTSFSYMDPFRKSVIAEK